jgi:fructose-bisphosphate aldolase class I
MEKTKLSKIARQIVSLGKGILAADESTPTITKRFKSIDTGSTPELRRAYRNILFTTEGLEQYISGVIMYDETIKQKTFEGIPFPKYLSDKGILTGIKVDKGAKEMTLHEGEKLTEGLDGLRERLKEYKELGASFTKWRAVISIGKEIPSYTCIKENAINLARFAATSQECGLVPIVEPEVLMDGTQNIDQSLEITEKVLKNTFSELHFLNVFLEGIILKCNMVLEGYNSLNANVPDWEVAEKTLKCLSRTVPPAVPGITFLSGGQSFEDATKNLNLINKLIIPGIGKWPWRLSFSYGRALQQPALQAWSGNMDNTKETQAALLHRASCNSEATMGVYRST